MRNEHDFIGFIQEHEGIRVLNSIRNFKTKLKYLGGQPGNQAWKVSRHWIKSSRIGDPTGRNVSPAFVTHGQTPLSVMINHILWKAGGKEEEEPFCPLLLVFLVFCLSEFSLFSSCLKASYAGYVLIAMQHLIVNTYCATVYLFMTFYGGCTVF